MKRLLSFLFALLIVPVAFAAVDVSYTFKESINGNPIMNVSGSVYNCADSSCGQVSPFTGSVRDPAGPSANFHVTDGTIKVRYPNNLHVFKYATFFASKGYLPKAYRVDLHTNGNSNVLNTAFIVEFNKKASCKAVVTNLNFVNQAQPNIPMIINARTQLDAQTASAFELVTTDVAYVPQEFIQEHYAVDTIVTMDILRNGAVVHSQIKYFNASNGNAIVASTSSPVQFQYTPTSTGSFVVRLTSKVTDSQCASQTDMSAQGNFDVLNAAPVGQHYTILNNLSVSNVYPKINEQVTVSYNKITNHADGSGVLTPVQTDADHIVTFNGNVFYSNSLTIPSNPGATQPVSNQFTEFTFTPTQPGVYNITVKGKANSVLPTSQPEITDEESVLVYVNDLGSYKVEFTVKNSVDGSPIVGANVDLASQGAQTTSAEGFAVFSNVPEGIYKYVITAQNFGQSSDYVAVSTDKQVLVVLHPGQNNSLANTAPLIDLPDQIQIEQGRFGTINFWDYVDDDESPDDELELDVVSGDVNVSVSIDDNTGDVTFTPQSGFVGTNNIRFEVKDEDGKNAQDTVVVTVVSTASGPVWGGIPVIITPEDSPAVRIINLKDFVSDDDTPLDDLTFSILSGQTSALFTAQIVDKSFLSIFPRPNMNGLGGIVIEATDGISTAQNNLTLNVTPVNDAPEIIAKFNLPTLNSSQNFTLDLTQLFSDPDGDNLNFVASQISDVSIIVNNSTDEITIVPAQFVNGARILNVTAFDPAGLNATAQIVLNFNIPPTPFITAGFPVPDLTYFEDFNQSIDLTPHENDPVEGPGANGNALVWSIKLANDTSSTPSNYLNATDFEAFINQTTDTLLFVPKGNVTGIFNVTLRLSNSLGNFVDENISVTWSPVNDAPHFVNLTNQNANVGVPFVYNATAFDAENDSLVFSVVNSTLLNFTISPDGQINYTPFSSGIGNVTLQVCDNSSACQNGTFQITVNDFTSPLFGVETTPPNPSVYVPGANYTFSITVTDNGNLSNVTFEFNGQAINTTSNGSIHSASVIDLAAGIYQYRWTAVDNAGNSNSTIFANFTVDKATSALELSLDGTQGNITVPQNSNVSISANLTNTSGAISIFRDGVLIFSNSSPILINESFPIQGNFNITAEFAGNQNYSQSIVSHFVNVPDTVSPIIGSTVANPVSPAQFGSQYNFTVSVTDNVAVSSVILEIDSSTNVTASNISATNWLASVSGLSVGNHTLVWHAQDLNGNNATIAPFIYEVTPGTGQISLAINGVSGNVNIPVNDTVTIVANVTNPSGGNVNIYVNGTLVQSGASPQTVVTSFSSLGVISVVAEFPGDVNVSAANSSASITVVPQVTATNVAPVSGSHFNQSAFSLTWETPSVTTCAWDFSDVNQALMTGSVVSVNGLNHSASISGYSLGQFNVSVACNSQSSGNNTDIVFFADNFLDGSVLAGVNSIVNTIMFNSTISNLTSTGGIGARNTLTDVVSIQSNISDTTFINSNSTQSAIQLSQIWNSDIQFCTIVNSSFMNATAVGCNITNDVIYSGEISVGGITYNATTSGPANLSAVIPISPVSSFTPVSSTINPGAVVLFTSTSTDSNIPGPLNDNLTFNWTFSDGDNFTNETFSKQFNIAGTFNVTLTVTDTFGFSSAATGQINVVSPAPPSGGGGGGGSGGGGGGRRYGSGGGSGVGIELSASETVREVFTGQPLKFSVNGITLVDAIYLRSASTLTNSTQWIIGGRVYSLAQGESRSFDLNSDGVLDLKLRLVNVTRTGAFVGTSRAEGTVGGVSPFPLFNFTGISQPAAQDITQPVVGEIEVIEGPQTEEVVVPLESGKEGSSILSSIKGAMAKVKDALSAGWTARAIIMISVVLVGLLAYTLFVRWERF